MVKMVNGLKIASFWVSNSTTKKSPRLPHLCMPGKKIILNVGGGMIEIHNIYPWLTLRRCSDCPPGRRRFMGLILELTCFKCQKIKLYAIFFYSGCKNSKSAGRIGGHWSHSRRCSDGPPRLRRRGGGEPCQALEL